MDTVTHALFGALASQAITKRLLAKKCTSGSGYVPLVVTTIASAFPDSDYFLFLIDPLIFLSDWHRTFTHSFVLLPVWTILLTSVIVFLFPKLRQHWLMISGFITLGLTTHIMLDLLTVYGTKIFYPLSDRSFSFGTTFIIDPYLTLIIIIGLIMSFFYKQRSTAMVFISVLCVYVLFQWYLKLKVQEISEGIVHQANNPNISIDALPQPFSPFHWRIINYEKGQYSTALIDLLGLSEKLKHFEEKFSFIRFVSPYRDINKAEWEHYSLFGDQPVQQSLAREVWQHSGMKHFREFAVYPILYRIDQKEGQTCVWFSDLRYHISVMIPSFRYGMCRDKNQGWQRYRLRYFTLNKRQLID